MNGFQFAVVMDTLTQMNVMQQIAGIVSFVEGPCLDLDNAAGLWKRFRRAKLSFCKADSSLFGDVSVRGIIKKGAITEVVSPDLVKDKNDLLLLVTDPNGKVSYLGISELSGKK